MMSPVLHETLLRVTGASLLVLGGLHVVFWRHLDWTKDSARLSAINARVFVVHTFFIVYVLVALGLLTLVAPQLLLARTPLALVFSAGLSVFFGLRMLAQPLVFDSVFVTSKVTAAVSALSHLVWLFYVVIFAFTFVHQLGWEKWPVPVTPFDLSSGYTWARIAIAAVWLTFGFGFKLLDAVPRHRDIVGQVLGERWAVPVVRGVGLGECVLGLWMLSGIALVACVVVQTAAIVAMNTLELRSARRLLLSPRWMLLANAGLLALGWVTALRL